MALTSAGPAYVHRPTAVRRGGWKGALERGEFRGIAKLLWMRTIFISAVLCPSPLSPRSRTNIIALAGCGQLAGRPCSALLLLRAQEAWIGSCLVVLLAAVWGPIVFIHPESRLMMLVFHLAWAMGPPAGWQACWTARKRGRLDGGVPMDKGRKRAQGECYSPS